MRKRVTNTEQFIETALAIHGDKFGYEDSNYVGSKKYITIRCKEHGNFETIAGNHLSGAGSGGCVQCKMQITRESRLDTLEDFVRKARAVHGDKYDYSEVNYVNDTTKVVIICNNHGPYSITPDSHKRGSKCWHCANQDRGDKHRDNLEDFLIKARGVHGDKYDYSLITEYHGNKVKLPIKCHDHGIFHQAPDNHKEGKGCPVCQPGGYSTLNEGSFYILGGGGITKAGITNKGAESRAKYVNASGGISLEVLYEFKTKDGAVPPNIERRVLAYLNANFQRVSQSFNGSTECFVDVNRQELMQIVETIVKQG